jgi:hypothetical protein
LLLLLHLLQMHIHLAQPYPSLMASIAHAHHALKLKAFQLDCGTLTATTRLAKCKVAQSADSNNPQVRRAGRLAGCHVRQNAQPRRLWAHA